jgi:hypothetical protein
MFSLDVLIAWVLITTLYVAPTQARQPSLDCCQYSSSWFYHHINVCWSVFNHVILALHYNSLCCLFIVLWYAGRAGAFDLGNIRLPDSESSKLMTDHVPACLHFRDITYTLSNRTILLDILARKHKHGVVSGTTVVNGREVADAQFKQVMGFVDQEDTLMSTLTVYETVLYSALLRLPREMSYEAKKMRTLETMNELGILGIKDSRIGESGEWLE